MGAGIITITITISATTITSASAIVCAGAIATVTAAVVMLTGCRGEASDTTPRAARSMSQTRLATRHMPFRCTTARSAGWALR